MESEKTKILMFPWLGHGHMIPFLELAKRMLKRRNFHIYFCTTSINFSSIKNFIDNNSLQNSIELVQLDLQPCPELPPHYHTTKNLPSNLKFTLVKAFQTSESSFRSIVADIKPDLVIYDIFQPWAARLASSEGIPAVFFYVFPVAKAAFLYHYYPCSDVKFPFDELYFVDREKECQDNFVKFMNADGQTFDTNFNLSCSLVLIKTSRCFEGKYVDYVSEKSKRTLVPVGPLVTDSFEENSEIIEWLDKKDKLSTLYISFGSESFLSREEIQEIAKALELCKDVNFIWVIRFPIEEKSVNVEETLPVGFLDRVKDRGMVVEWAPQTHILAHPSSGGFLNHCGWSSMNESLYCGVPLIAMQPDPIYFVDVRMAVGAGVCLEIPRDENYVCKGDDIAKAINMVMYENTGQELRKRAGELSEKCCAEAIEIESKHDSNLNDTRFTWFGNCLRPREVALFTN